MKPMKMMLTALGLAACLLFLCACGVPVLEKKGDTYVDSKTGVAYVYAPQNYIAISVSDEQVVKIPKNVEDDLILYAVENMDTARFLTTENGTLFCAEGITLPALWELPVASVAAYGMQSATLSVASVTDAEDISALQTTYRDGTFFARSDIYTDASVTSYSLRFVADGDAYTGLAYTLYYLQYSKDVCLYVTVEDEASFENPYPGLSYHVEDRTYEDPTTGNTVTERLAVYELGSDFLYDRSTGLCCMAGDVLRSYVEE